MGLVRVVSVVKDVENNETFANPISLLCQEPDCGMAVLHVRWDQLLVLQNPQVLRSKVGWVSLWTWEHSMVLRSSVQSVTDPPPNGVNAHLLRVVGRVVGRLPATLLTEGAPLALRRISTLIF